MQNSSLENKQPDLQQTDVICRASRELPHPDGHTVTEFFDTEVHGSCSCGEKVTKVVNSNFTCRTDKVRYRYTDGLDEGWCIFSCRNCEGYIGDTWHGI